MNEALKNFRNNTGLPIEEVLKTVTINPARLIGINAKKGSLDQDKDADIVIFDEEFHILNTFCKGDLCYENQ